MEPVQTETAAGAESESDGGKSVANKPSNKSSIEDDPDLVGKVLVDLLLGSARLVQLSKEVVQLVNDKEDSPAGEALTLSRELFLNAQMVGQYLLTQLNYSSFEALFQSQHPLPPGHQDFRNLMLDEEFRRLTLDSLQPGDSPTKRRLMNCCSICGLSLGPYDGSPCKNPNLKPGAGACCHDHDECLDSADLLVPRGRSPSQHKQLEALRIEENMGGTYITQRRRSPRRSPSFSTEGLSPLVSEKEFTALKPVSHSPSRKVSTKFLNKVLRGTKPEGTDGELDATEGKVAWF